MLSEALPSAVASLRFRSAGIEVGADAAGGRGRVDNDGETFGSASELIVMDTRTSLMPAAGMSGSGADASFLPMKLRCPADLVGTLDWPRAGRDLLREGRRLKAAAGGADSARAPPGCRDGSDAGGRTTSPAIRPVRDPEEMERATDAEPFVRAG